MHELSITKSLMNILEGQAVTHNVKRVTKVILKIGRFTAVEPLSLIFCFQSLSKDTLFEGAVIEVNETPGDELDLVSMEAE